LNPVEALRYAVGPEPEKVDGSFVWYRFNRDGQHHDDTPDPQQSTEAHSKMVIPGNTTIVMEHFFVEGSPSLGWLSHD